MFMHYDRKIYPTVEINSYNSFDNFVSCVAVVQTIIGAVGLLSKVQFFKSKYYSKYNKNIFKCDQH